MLYSFTYSANEQETMNQNEYKKKSKSKKGKEKKWKIRQNKTNGPNISKFLGNGVKNMMKNHNHLFYASIHVGQVI